MANTRLLQLQPAGDTLPGGETIPFSPSPFATGGIKPPGPPFPPPPSDVDYGIIRLRALEGYTRNHSGNPITGYDIGGVDPVFSNIVAYLYPGAASDDNDVQFEVPVPQDMDLADPQITVILHFLIPDAPYTPAPIPGGLPVGCEGSFLMYISGAYESVKFTVDNLGFITTDNTGVPVVSEC